MNSAQVSNADFAAVTARSTSSRDDRGTAGPESPVAGLMLWRVLEVDSNVPLMILENDVQSSGPDAFVVVVSSVWPFCEGPSWCLGHSRTQLLVLSLLCNLNRVCFPPKC